MMVLPVRFKMACQKIDPLGKEGNLHRRGAGIGSMNPVILDHFVFLVFN